MSGKIITAMAAAILLASTALASATENAPNTPRHDRSLRGYYNMAPNSYTDTGTAWTGGSDSYGSVPAGHGR